MYNHQSPDSGLPSTLGTEGQDVTPSSDTMEDLSLHEEEAPPPQLQVNIY